MNSPLQTRIDTHQFGGVDYHIRCLVDGNQFDDPEGIAEALGISPASWPFFGMRWPSGLLLADLVSRLALGKGRMLELGCGLGIASLVARCCAQAFASRRSVGFAHAGLATGRILPLAIWDLAADWCRAWVLSMRS